jgi:predicted RNase H-like nuclease (RuvC/YqgF family)
METPMHSRQTPLTYAQALTDARSLIVQQASRIKSDGQKIRAQAEEIAQLRAMAEEMAAAVERLRQLESRLAEEHAARERAEAIVGRQQMEIEALESASRGLHKILGDQAARVNDLTAELEQTRGALPSDEDEAALEAMTSLLSAARKPRRDSDAAQSADEHGPRIERMVIPSGPTPFCQIAERKAA